MTCNRSGRSTGRKKRTMGATMKVVVVGESTVGKTSLVARFTADSAPPRPESTIGVDIQRRTIAVNGTAVHLEIWVRCLVACECWTGVPANSASLL